MSSVAPVWVEMAGFGRGMGGATGRILTESPSGEVSGPKSWFPVGRSCFCSVPHGVSSGMGPSRAEGNRRASHARDKTQDKEF